MILLAYDGSEDADGAMDRVAQLMPGANVTVLTVWEPVGRFERTGPVGGPDGGWADVKEIDASKEAWASSQAQAGAARATNAGLHAVAQHVPCEDGVAPAILLSAQNADAQLIAMGTRGLARLKSLLLGSVSHAVVQHADRAVLVVPSKMSAERRHEHLQREQRSSDH